MKKRIPLDIEFLLESILSEDPDRFSITDDDVAKFKKLGMNMTAGRTYWSEPDAYPFFIEPKDRIVIYQHNGVHGNLQLLLNRSVMRLDSESGFAFAYEFSNMQGDIGFVSKRDKDYGCYFHGLKGNDLNDVRAYLDKHWKYFEDLEIRGPGGEGKVEAYEIAGRVWVDKRVISFWNDKDKVMPYMKEIFSFMKNYNMNVEKCLYEFIDSRGFYTHYELTGNLPDTKEKLSAAEKQELLAQKHMKITPDAQKKFKAEFPSQHWRDKGKKAAKGFEFPAKASAAMPAREGIIKLKDLLKENPDSVMSPDGTMEIASSEDSDGIAFYAFPNFSILYPRGIHPDMMQDLVGVHSNLKLIRSNPEFKKDTKDSLIEDGYLISNFDAMIDELENGKLGEFISKDGWLKPGHIHIRASTGGLAGRIWTSTKIISFWNDADFVVKNWDYVKKMFDSFGKKIGNINNYKIDWIERDVRGGGELTPARSISKSRSQKQDDGKENNLIDKLFGGQPISKEEIQDIQRRLHKMSPKEKKQALMKLGASNTKASEIADKLGMTVAEFNHIMNVNEDVGIIKLKDLINESPDFVISVDGKDRMVKYTDFDAVAFFVYPKFSAINVGGTHSDIMEVLQRAYDNIDSITDNIEEKKEFIDYIQRKDIQISDIEAMLDSVYSGPLANFIKGGVHDDDEPGAFRIKSGGLAGRLWLKRKVISFWNDSDEVISKWSDVERLYNDFSSNLGNLDEYQVDWLERDVRNGGPLTPASSISSSRKQPKNDNQLNFLDKLAGEDPISKEEILKIQRRLHTLKPKEKKEALMKLGALNMKAPDIADKLGMTVAEFNHIMNVNENDNA